MLTEKERTQLAPLLARVRNTRAESAAADQVTSAAATLREKARNLSGWRDRWFGGHFSREPARADAYRNARRAWTSAAAASSELTKQITKLEQKLDDQIVPMMPRLDPRYRQLAAAINSYDQALKHCLHMRMLIAKATDAAHTATKNPGRDGKDHQAAASARSQYPKLVTQARHAARDAQLALYSVSQIRQAVSAGSPHVAWDAVLLDRLPGAVDDISTLKQLARAQGKLQRATTRLNSWRAQATAAQQRAVQATRESLIKDPAY